MHFFSSILFKSRSPTLFSSSTTMETSSNSQEEETGLKSLTSPSNHNHSSMINRFNISPQSSSASSSCTSPSSPVSISPCWSSSSSFVYSVDDDDGAVSTDETPVTNHHQKQEEITEKPFYDHRKNVIIVRNQRSGIRREFPPPIPLLARTENLPCHMPWVLKRSYKDGRLVIKEVNVKHHEYFRAHRSNGRLTLQLMHMNQLTIHPPPIDTSSTTPTTDDIEEEEEEEQEEEDNVDVNDLVDFDNDDKDEKKNEDNKKDDDENDGVLSEQEQGSDEEEEVERPSADPLHHIRQRFRPSEQPSSSLPQCQIHETKEGKQDFEGEILRNCSQPLILASSLPEGRVRGMCQPNDIRKSNLFRLPIVSVRPVHS
ncbi:hypothetical protein MKX03_016354 [Papaver bracteatum]|nr:hypothetical protein MKX03_016354 [Papaver bracteatum]